MRKLWSTSCLVASMVLLSSVSGTAAVNTKAVMPVLPEFRHPHTELMEVKRYSKRIECGDVLFVIKDRNWLTLKLNRTYEVREIEPAEGGLMLRVSVDSKGVLIENDHLANAWSGGDNITVTFYPPAAAADKVEFTSFRDSSDYVEGLMMKHYPKDWARIKELWVNGFVCPTG